MLHLKVFFLELAQLGCHSPEFTCPDHDSTSTGTLGTCFTVEPCMALTVVKKTLIYLNQIFTLGCWLYMFVVLICESKPGHD